MIHFELSSSTIHVQLCYELHKRPSSGHNADYYSATGISTQLIDNAILEVDLKIGRSEQFVTYISGRWELLINEADCQVVWNQQEKICIWVACN